MMIKQLKLWIKIKSITNKFYLEKRWEGHKNQQAIKNTVRNEVNQQPDKKKQKN